MTIGLTWSVVFFLLVLVAWSSHHCNAFSETPPASVASNGFQTTSPHEKNVLSPLSQTLDELASCLGGRGRAKAVWVLLRNGIDPLDDHASDFLPIGADARNAYLDSFGGRIEDSISQVTNIKVASDNTTKMLLQLHKDGLEVETVIIPWNDRKKSTLCISSQVGCRQGCTFCMTGRMGKLRSLTSDEILSQFFHAVTAARHKNLYPIDNVVFMGMGEPADNVHEVIRVANVLTDDNQFQLAPRRVTISTVAPNPQTFLTLAKAPAVLAWSVHASQDVLRKQLVPTTKSTMVELRQGLVEALKERPRRLRSIMLEVTLLGETNDNLEDADHLASFCEPILEQVLNTKLVINVIPWNDISASSGPAKEYRKPSLERVLAFQKRLVERGLRCYVRTTRGDDSEAACGQLATKRNKV